MKARKDMAAFGDSTHTGLGTNGFEVSLNYITGIPDPNILLCSNTLKLAFKSLLKRDTSTKEKSIVSLLDYIKENPDELNDDLIIITWVQMYPKLSIDDSKKVRSLSHQIQSHFVFVLGKSYAKYLKDTIGIWISGLFDTDKSTARICKDSIYSSFGNNEEKVSNLWKIFIQQILKYCHQVLAYETKDTLSDERFAGKDESEAKYLRVLQSSILMTVNAVAVANSLELNDQLKDIISDIYGQEILQDCFSSKDYNLKKSAYMCFRSLVISNHVDILMTKHLYKSLSKAMVKGIKFDSKVNQILYSNVLITILDTLVCVTSFDASFWLNIKKSDDKLLSLLKLGSLNSEPIYYDIVYKLLKILPKDLVSLKDSKKLAPFFNALLQSVGKEKSITFLEKGWKVIINIMLNSISFDNESKEILDNFTFSLIKLLDSPRLISPAISASMHELNKISNDDFDIFLDINAIIMDALPDKKLVFEDFNYTVNNTNTFVENFINLLVLNKSDLDEVLLANSIDALQEYDRTNSTPTLSFNVINIFIKKNRVEFTDTIKSFIECLPTFVTEEFIDLPLTTLHIYSHSSFINDNFINILVDEIFEIVEKLGLVNKLLKTVSKLKNFDIHETKNLNSYLVNNSRSLSPDIGDLSLKDNDHASLYSFLTCEILTNLFQNENFHTFVSNCLANYNNKIFLEFSKTTPKFIEDLFYTISSNDENRIGEYSLASELLEKLEQNLSADALFAKMYTKSLWKVIGSLDEKPTSLKHRVLTLSDDFALNLLNIDSLNTFDLIFSNKPNVLLAVGNSLDLGLYLFIDDLENRTEFDLNSSKMVINKATFYSDLLGGNTKLENVSFENLIGLALIAEFASDVLFLNYSLSNDFQEKIIEFQTWARLKISQLFSDFDYNDILKCFAVAEFDHKPFAYLSNIMKGNNKLKSYYSYRILKTLLSEKVESITYKEFEILDFKQFAKNPKLLFTLLESSKTFLTCKNLEYIRTNTVANLVSVRKSEDILSIGMTNLILLNNFMDLDLDYEIPEDLVLFAPQRFIMLLNTIFNWLDSEVAYDEGFKLVRILLMQFSQRYINGVYYVCDNNYPSDFINKVFKLGLRSLSENLNIVNSEEEICFDLLHFSLKEYLILVKYKEHIEDWEDEILDIENEILELFFKVSKINNISQPVEIICDQFSRILNKEINFKTIEPYYERLYELIGSENTKIQRISCSLLHNMIPSIQDTLVVEFTLSKKKANEDGESGIYLPETLIQNVSSKLTDYIEYEDQWRVNQYLWSWYLVMDHFKNITQQMRQDYISHLGDDKISSFLNFIFNELDVGKFKLHDDDENYVKDYSFNDSNILNATEENRKILVNLVYEIMNNIGGTFAQTWFQSIKDKQLQQNVEKFIVKFISPQLINDILSTLSNKTSIEDSEFKININRKINEIKCLYNIDEQQMEISIVLPFNFPLSQITVNGVSRVGVDEKKWKSWIMSAQYVINFQNGTILDSIKHFKDNVTANFENYEDCAICYSILNSVDHSTPNKVCPTCKHNFHSACLYRWFKSSSTSTCPLCRSKFHFKKHS